MKEAWNGVWEEWKSVTRLVRSGDIAFEYERARWLAIAPEQLEKSEVLIGKDENGKKYRVSLSDHMAALSDEQTFGSIVLLHSYGLMERHIRTSLRALDNKGQLASLTRWTTPYSEDGCRAYLSTGGIETWGRDIMDLLGYDWSKSIDGIAGMVEVSIVRNAISHGVKNVTERMINRAQAASATLPWLEHDPIVITMERVARYQARLKNFMQTVQNGAEKNLR